MAQQRTISSQVLPTILSFVSVLLGSLLIFGWATIAWDNDLRGLHQQILVVSFAVMAFLMAAMLLAGMRGHIKAATWFTGLCLPVFGLAVYAIFWLVNHPLVW